MTGRMVPASEWADARGVPRRRVSQWTSAGRIQGAVKVEGRWFIPITASVPEPRLPGDKPGPNAGSPRSVMTERGLEVVDPAALAAAGCELRDCWGGKRVPL